ncbi:MAG: Fic family protein [Halieaceae bacterium]|nr:Fic family protein [Halieaceae bacterium]
MNPEYFRNSSSGRLVRVGQGEYAYWTFAPNPLPPKLSLDLPLLQTLSRADRALGELAGLGRTISNPHLLIRPFIRREAVLSSRIEGTQADVVDLYAYEAGRLALPGIEPYPPESDVREVLNYVHALEYGLERLQTLSVSLRLFRELHQRLMSGVRGEKLTPGEFRRSQNWIGRPGCTLEEADYVPPSLDDLLDALSSLESYLHREPEYPPLIRLAFIHYQFEAIHPFLDGNGRIGRLLITLLLSHWELLPLPLLYLSAYFHRHRDRYYDLLMAVSKDGAWRDWTDFFLNGVTEQSRDAIERAKQLQDLQQAWHQELERNRSTGLMYSVVDLLFMTPILTANDLVERFDVTHRTAMLTLRKLESLDVVHEISGRRRNQQYMATAIMQIIQ